MEDFINDIDKCLQVLKDGGLILYPTDTLWGIGCDATNEVAVEKIYALKHRADEKKMIVLMATEKEIMQHVTQLDLAVFDYLAAATKPTTVVYEGVIGLAENILGEDYTVGIRICRDEFCKHLIKRFQKPIVSSSANISGQPAPRCFAEINSEILEGVDYIVDFRREDTTPGQPSAIIKWDNDGSPIFIRS